MYNKRKQLYYVLLRSTFARPHVNFLMWNRQFLEARDDSNEYFSDKQRLIASASKLYKTMHVKQQSEFMRGSRKYF